MEMESEREPEGQQCGEQQPGKPSQAEECGLGPGSWKREGSGLSPEGARLLAPITAL